MTDVPIYDIVIHQGEDWSETYVYEDDNGTAQDITGYKAKLQLRDRPGGTLYLELSSENGGVLIDGPNGEISPTMTSAVSDALKFQTAYHDMFLIDTDSKRHYLFRGKTTVTRRIADPSTPVA